jgi:Zn-dependent protease with chaperone function
MDKNRAKIEELLAKAEEDLSKNPKLYERKLFHYSLLGYGIILAICFVLFGLVVGSIWLALSSSMFLLLLFKKKLFIPLFIMVWVLFKSVFIRWPKPEGIILLKEQSPDLFNIIEEIRTDLNAPKIHQVLVTHEFNAAIIQTPRFLAFGFTHNTLVLGFELLVSLSTKELTSVVAHELAHLSGNHSKFHGWIYQARDSWQKMMYNLDQHNGWTTAPIRKFFNWYSPRFSAYSFALARLNEYEADEIAAQKSSIEAASSALLKLPAYSNFIQEKYWVPFNRRALDKPEPIELPYMGLLKFMEENEVSYAEASSSIEFAKKETTNYQDTHPCLSDRLVALKGEHVSFSTTTESAATTLLGNRIKEIAKTLDHFWSEWNIEQWKEEYSSSQKERNLLRDLELRSIEDLDREQLWQLSTLAEKHERTEQPLKLYQTFDKLYPDDVYCQLAIGRLLLDDMDDAGLTYLERVSSKHELLEVSAKIAYSYLVENDRLDEAKSWLDKTYSLDELYREANLERQSITKYDTIEPTTVSEDELEHFVQQIKSNNKVKAAWVAQKKVNNFKDSQVLIFALQAKSGFYLSDNLAEKILDSLEFKSDNMVFMLTKGNDSSLFKLVKSTGKQVI